jgi:hypothetical protein
MLDRWNVFVLHGGHTGTEAEFGRAAEKWGVREVTLSYEGHRMERAHNVETLGAEELDKGQVSLEFVFQRMGRRFVQGKGLRAVLKMMFHLVVRADEVFAVGWIQPEGVVRGGTGWGVELAKLFNRPVHVFDQDREAWFTWDGMGWKPSTPTIRSKRIAATGTRNLTEPARRAIHDLFERSLGPAHAQHAMEQSR